MGGTFDHLHAGHRELLTLAALVTTKRLLIGVTADEMLATKSDRSLMQPLDDRVRAVREFLAEVAPALDVQLVPITDPFGPSITDPDLQAIVVSTETIKGAQAVNAKREGAGLSKLRVIAKVRHETSTLSSSRLRQYVKAATDM